MGRRLILGGVRAQGLFIHEFGMYTIHYNVTLLETNPREVNT